MATIHLVIGPVGAGKSTFVQRLCREHGAQPLLLDEWMAVLFRPDRPATGLMPWYAERVQRCLDLIWTLTERMLDAGTDVVLEIGLIQRAEREHFYSRVDGAERALRVYLLDAPREVRRERVERRNRERGATFAMVVPPEIFELASDLWQPPDDAERLQREIRDAG